MYLFCAFYFRFIIVKKPKAPSPASSSDADIQKAIEESLKTRVSSNDGQPSEEDQMQQAVLASLQTSENVLTYNAPLLKREIGNFTGLKNVGNTCYLNSLLQTYFMIPSMRKMVLESKYDKSHISTNDMKFMTELQRLFAFMYYTNQKWINPSKLFDNFIKESGESVTIGLQEDVGEYNDLFLHRVMKGMDNSKVFDDLFEPKVVEILETINADSSGVESEVNIGRNIILPVGRDNFYFAVDTFLCDELEEWVSSDGTKVPASKWRWFKQLPKILMFQQQRIIFEGTQQKKSNDLLNFPIDLWMDRYMLENKQFVSEKRKDVNEWRKELDALNELLNERRNYGGNNVSLEVTLQAMQKYLSSFSDDEELHRFKNFVNEKISLEESKTQSLIERANTIDNDISIAFDPIKKVKYQLFAVWIHSGTAGTGHYWSYIMDLKSKQWVRFNDEEVSVVSLETVLSDAIGGVENKSAYFLIYLESEFLESQASASDDYKLETSLKQEIDKSNQEFETKLNAENESTNTSMVDSFLKLYKSKTDQALESLANLDLMNDKRVSSYFVFLASLGLVEEMKASVAMEMWLRIFTRGIEKDVNSDVFQLTAKKIEGGEEFLNHVVKFSKTTDFEANTHFKTFRQAHQFMAVGIRNMLELQYKESLRYLLNAFVKNSHLYDTIQIPFILPLIKVNILKQLALLSSKNGLSVVQDIKHALGVIGMDVDDPFMDLLRDKILIIGNDDISNAILSYEGEHESVRWKLQDPKEFDSLSTWENQAKETGTSLRELFENQTSDIEKEMKLLDITLSPKFNEKMSIDP